VFDLLTEKLLMQLKNEKNMIQKNYLKNYFELLIDDIYQDFWLVIQMQMLNFMKEIEVLVQKLFCEFLEIMMKKIS
jgi:hypothetical protein